jgi:hypothetical protein
MLVIAAMVGVVSGATHEGFWPHLPECEVNLTIGRGLIFQAENVHRYQDFFQNRISRFHALPLGFRSTSKQKVCRRRKCSSYLRTSMASCVAPGCVVTLMESDIEHPMQSVLPRSTDRSAFPANLPPFRHRSSHRVHKHPDPDCLRSGFRSSVKPVLAGGIGVF